MQFCFFTSQGGVSHGAYDSLNISYHVGDQRRHVDENRRRLKQRLGVSRLVSARQVHGDRIYLVSEQPSEDCEVDGYDALLTRQRDVGLLIQLADCQAILLHDSSTGAIAAIHCGWRGSVAGLIGKSVAAMEREFTTDPSDLAATIGPSLGPCCAEFVNYRDELPVYFQEFQVSPNHFDFWEISARQLTDAGVPIEQIQTARVCTSCSSQYFSYRRACRRGDGTTGRHGAMICLPSI